MSDRCWIAVLDERAAGADVAAALADADGAPCGWFAAWSQSAKPVRNARRADPRIIDPDGPPATISLVLPPRDALAPFDDPAVQQARRAILADAEPADLVTTLLVDDSHFAGSLTARRGPDAARVLRDDPFVRVWPARLLTIANGALGVVPPPPGPVIERHGSAVPWPGGTFAT